MTLNNLNKLIEMAKNVTKKPIVSVAVAADLHVLEAVEKAIEEQIIEAILVGNKPEIEKICQEHNLKIDSKIIHEEDPIKATEIAVGLIVSNEADLLMKGLVDTKVVLKEVLKAENGLRTGRTISHMTAFKVNTIDRVLFLTDAAMNIAPTFEQKQQIIENSVIALTKLGIEQPKVAVLSAVEKVNDKMPSSVDAFELAKLNQEGWLSQAIIGGPFALDNAIDEESAQIKGINHPIAGKADLLVVPAIEAGNVLYKAIHYFAHGEQAGVILGAKIPIILTSRSDSSQSKLLSITLASLLI